MKNLIEAGTVMAVRNLWKRKEGDLVRDDAFEYVGRALCTEISVAYGDERKDVHTVPKNIVVCLDGTNNQFGDRTTNAVKLYRVCQKIPDKQLVYYHPGLGTMGGPSALTFAARLFTRGLGLAFGYGLSQVVADAYTFVANCYSDGDQLYVFGFSRGAYMARVLCAIIKLYGLVRPGDTAVVPYMIRLAKRQQPEGSIHRDTAEAQFRIAAHFKKTFSRPCGPKFLGIWDTVTSVGWFGNPLAVPYTAVNPDIATVRHAVSIDERRAFYRQNLWRGADPGQCREVWFAGVHSDVGGGYAESDNGLSQITLEWMLCEAIQHGLLIDLEDAAHLLGYKGTGYVRPNPDAEPHNSLCGAWWILEYLPKPYWNFTEGRCSWMLYRGRPRHTDGTTVFHASVKPLARYAARITSTSKFEEMKSCVLEAISA